MSPIRPDLVECWPFRVVDSGLEILLIRRAPGRPYAGMWQCVTGRLEDGETVVEAVLREVAEETALGPADILALYSLDLVNAFFEPSADGILVEPVFAIQVGAGSVPVTSTEHDGQRWLSPDGARALVVWPAHLTAIERIRALVSDRRREPWFRLRPDGSRMVD
ncbi:MAG: NUDIX domain-containing protein [Chloroflexota bacterium]|nr:NUDIX domain-containing protein [Chloroflexota bacterium]